MLISIFSKFKDEIYKWGRVVKFSHTIFALPFALAMLVVVLRDTSFALTKSIWIILALVSARTAAMGFNRYLDRIIDKKNPRTSAREIPNGVVSKESVAVLFILSSGIFLLSAAALGNHAFVLAPLVLGILFFYSWTKRFTRYSHLVLGLCLAMAPGGVWYALTASVEMIPVWMMLAVMFWVAGFDVIYSCQDYEFDKKENLFSIPVALGINKALVTAKILHIGAIFLFVIFGLAAAMGTIYFITVAIFAVILFSQHLIVKADDLSRVNEAFFSRNGIAAVVYFIGVVVDTLLG